MAERNLVNFREVTQQAQTVENAAFGVAADIFNTVGKLAK